VGEIQASDGGDLQPADLHAVVAAVAGVVGDRGLAPRQGLELLVQRGLVGLRDQQVGGVLCGDQLLGMLTLGVERIGGDPVPVRSSRSSSGWNRAISPVVGATSVWARTARVGWSIAASRCTCAAPWWPLPRRVLPSTATACRHAAGLAGVGRVVGGVAAGRSATGR
jgi:hypothetical protein